MFACLTHRYAGIETKYVRMYQFCLRIYIFHLSANMHDFSHGFFLKSIPDHIIIFDRILLKKLRSQNFSCSTWIGNGNAAEKVSLTARDDVLGFPGFELETIQGIVMTVCDFYALTEQGFVYAGRTVGYDFDDAAEGDGAWPLDLTGDGRSELITRSTFGDGMSCVFVYRWNAAEGGSQRSEVDWDKADAQLARLSAPLGVTARAETYHAQDNTVTLTLYTESGTKETTLPLTTDILGEWSTE